MIISELFFKIWGAVILNISLFVCMLLSYDLFWVVHVTNVKDWRLWEPEGMGRNQARLRSLKISFGSRSALTDVSVSHSFELDDGAYPTELSGELLWTVQVTAFCMLFVKLDCDVVSWGLRLWNMSLFKLAEVHVSCVLRVRLLRLSPGAAVALLWLSATCMSQESHFCKATAPNACALSLASCSSVMLGQWKQYCGTNPFVINQTEGSLQQGRVSQWLRVMGYYRICWEAAEQILEIDGSHHIPEARNCDENQAPSQKLKWSGYAIDDMVMQRAAVWIPYNSFYVESTTKM